MKHIATMTLTLTLGVASVYAQQHRVNMRFSGSGGPSPIDLQQPNSVNFEENVTGDGSLGPFTYHDLRAASFPPQTSSTCSGPLLPPVFGGGIIRFQDGSLLTFSIKPNEGGDCIDLVQKVARCTLTLEITGGTGRFRMRRRPHVYRDIGGRTGIIRRHGPRLPDPPIRGDYRSDFGTRRAGGFQPRRVEKPMISASRFACWPVERKARSRDRSLQPFHGRRSTRCLRACGVPCNSAGDTS
jgi:hypothetical protein